MNSTFFARRSFLILVVAVFFMPFLLRGTRLALQSNRNDIKDWLPDGFEQTADHHWFQEKFPHEQFVLVSWEGCTLDDPRLPFLANELVNPRPKECEPGQPWYFRHVMTGESLVRDMRDRDPNLTETEVFRRLEGTLLGKDHYKTCLVVTLTDHAKGKNLRPMLDKLRDMAKEYCDVNEGELRLGGPPVDNVSIDVEGERTIFRLAALSAVVGLGISWLCFRSIRLMLLVFLVALLAAGIGLASVFFAGLIASLLGFKNFAATYGTCDAVLLSMPSLVYVLALSGAVHIVNYYHDEVRNHGIEGAVGRAVAHGWKPCALAAFTTALGLGSLLESNLVPINKFGIYSAWGVLATLSLLFLFLPACLYFFPSREYVRGGAKNRGDADQENIFIRFWQAVGRLVIRHNVSVAVVCVLVMGFFAWGLTRVESSVSLIKLFSPEARIIKDYTWLEEHLGPLVPMEVVVRIDNDKCKLNTVKRMRMVRDMEAAIEECSDEIGGALSAATFAPDIGKTHDEAKFRFAWNWTESVTSTQLDKYRSEFRDYLTVDLEAADRKARESGVDPTLEELGVSPEVAQALKMRGISSLLTLREHAGLRPIEETIASVRDVTPEQAAEAAAAVDQWRTAHGEELWRITARVKALTSVDYSVFVEQLKEAVEKVLNEQYTVLSDAEKAQGIEPVEGITITYTGLVPLVYRAQHELMDGLFWSLLLAFVLIAIVMILVLRSPSAGMLSMAPNLFPVVVIFGLMGWLDILVDVGTMMTASVALGVAVDDTIHFLTWYRRGLDSGRDRKSAVMLAYERCATAMSQTTLIAGLGLSAFAFSTFTPTQRFGVLMLALLGAALVGDLIFLPAVLSGPFGRFFRGARKKKKVPDGPAPSEEPTAPLPDDEVMTVPIGSTGTARRMQPDSSRSSRVS